MSREDVTPEMLFEPATRFDINPGNARIRVHRCLEALREALRVARAKSSQQ